MFFFSGRFSVLWCRLLYWAGSNFSCIRATRNAQRNKTQVQTTATCFLPRLARCWYGALGNNIAGDAGAGGGDAIRLQQTRHVCCQGCWSHIWFERMRRKQIGRSVGHRLRSQTGTSFHHLEWTSFGYLGSFCRPCIRMVAPT